MEIRFITTRSPSIGRKPTAGTRALLSGIFGFTLAVATCWITELFDPPFSIMQVTIETLVISSLGFFRLRSILRLIQRVELATIELKQRHLAAGRSPRRRQHLEVLKRSGVILAVTAWETFIEDMLVDRFRQILECSVRPSQVESAFGAATDRWLQGKPKPAALASWTGKNWRSMLEDQLRADLERFHTPNSSNTVNLYKKYLGADISKTWHWPGVTRAKACVRLDSLIKFRGSSLVHRSKGSDDAIPTVPRSKLISAVDLVFSLATCTEQALNPRAEKAPAR